MINKKVMVLLSSYNGEKYIAEQIDSILGQTYDNITIFVRDDGSTDNTVAILKEYEAKGQIRLECGENCGFIASFLWLIEHSEGMDYYAFADQDDVWLPEKIELAIRRLEKTDGTKPVLYFSEYDFYDGQLHFLNHHSIIRLKPSFHNALVDCMPMGFCSVFNETACRLVREHKPKECCGHDWWMYMVCAGLGEVIYDEKIMAKHRRDGNNTSPGGMSFWKFQIWRIRKFVVNNYFENVHKQIKEYARLYGKDLSYEDKKVLHLFVRDKYSFDAFKKVCFPKRLRERVIDEIMLRCIFLIGKL